VLLRPVDFQSAYRDLYPSLFRYAHRFTGDADAAEDIVQEAFLRLLDQDLPDDEVRPWIFVVATNLARDRARKRERRRRLLAARGDTRGSVSSPYEDVERAERVAAVRWALEELSDRDRQMLLMREEGFRYVEIAEALGVRPTSVGALIARALKRFTAAYTATEGLNAPSE
jgi:RNA polymerase sigma-70 factor (ECF subfamily)